MDIIFPFTYSIIFVILLNISFRKKIKGIRIIDWLLSRRKVVLSILLFLLVILFFVFARNYLMQLAELIILGIIFLMSTIVLNSLIQNSHGFEPFTEEKSEWIRRKFINYLSILYRLLPKTSWNTRIRKRILEELIRFDLRKQFNSLVNEELKTFDDNSLYHLSLKLGFLLEDSEYIKSAQTFFSEITEVSKSYQKKFSTSDFLSLDKKNTSEIYDFYKEFDVDLK